MLTLLMGLQGNEPLMSKGSSYPCRTATKSQAYLQWDSKIEAVDKDYQYHLDHVFMMTGLSRVLFEPQFGSGTISGIILTTIFDPLCEQS